MTIFEDIEALRAKAETGEQWAHICRLETSAIHARSLGEKAVESALAGYDLTQWENGRIPRANV